MYSTNFTGHIGPPQNPFKVSLSELWDDHGEGIKIGVGLILLKVIPTFLWDYIGQTEVGIWSEDTISFMSYFYRVGWIAILFTVAFSIFQVLHSWKEYQHLCMTGDPITMIRKSDYSEWNITLSIDGDGILVDYYSVPYNEDPSSSVSMISHHHRYHCPLDKVAQLDLLNYGALRIAGYPSYIYDVDTSYERHSLKCRLAGEFGIPYAFYVWLPQAVIPEFKAALENQFGAQRKETPQ